MSIKDLFNNKGTPKIQKSVTTEEMVDQVESSEFVEAKRKQFDQFVPPIDFASASNFAKFGSAELYYEKAFERIYQYYPYDGTLHEKVEFENSSSYLDKYVFENLYPRTNGYVNFDNSAYITIFGGPHTASMGMDGKPLDSTFDYSMKYDEEKKRTSAFEFRGEDGITAEFWLKPGILSGQRAIFHISGAAGSGEILLQKTSTTGQIKLKLISGSSTIWEPTFDSLLTEDEWNHYAITLLSGSDGLTAKTYKNGQLFEQQTSALNLPHILPTTDSLNMTIGSSSASGVNKFTGSMDEFRFWKTARTPEDIFNTWFIPVGGGTNKYDANVDLSLYLKFNEGITGTEALDKIALDYSGRINNGTIVGYSSGFRSTGSAITEKLGEPEFQDPIIYSSHPDVVSKKAEYKTSGSLADLENTSMFYSYFPGWMQEEDEQNGKQLKYLSQIIGSYFDTLWHQIDFVNKIHDHHYVSGSSKALPFAKKLLYNKGFVIPDLFVDATKLENLRQKDDNEVFEKEINEVRNIIYHNLYSNVDSIYKSKGTEKAFRNFFRSIGIGQDVVKLKMYADDSTFVLRNNYEYKSYERKFVDFNVYGHFDATLFQTSSTNNNNVYIPRDSSYTGSFTLQSEVILPRKQRRNEVDYNPFPHLSSSVMGYLDGDNYTTATDGLQVFVVHSDLESTLQPRNKQRVKFVLTGSNINLESDWFSEQYENNKWSLAVRMKHSTYPRPNITGSTPDDYLVEFYGIEADGNTERNSFSLSTSSVAQSYYSSDKIFYAGAHKTNFSGSTLHYSDVKLGYVRYWHSYLSNDAIKQHAFDSETFGANEPFEQDLVDVYPVEIPREKTLAFHWAFNDLTGSDSSGEFLVSDLSSGSSNSDYGSLSNTIQRYVAAKGFGFNTSSSKVLDKNYLYSARKRLPDDLMSSDLTTIKTDETEQFFVDDDVSDNFYSFEKSMWGTISDEMMNMFSTALDLNNLIGQPNQRYHHKYGMAEFLRDRFFDDVENEPDIQKFTSFYKWIDDSISIALQQLVPASARFSEKINNIIESHVLERSKYVHQIPIATNFESTEGSIKGHAEMHYNWQYGHAPTDTSNEGNNVLWHQDRAQKEGLRETLRNSRNNHSIQSSGLIRREIDGTARLSDTYEVRKFAKTYDVDMVSQDTIHGGTNFGRKKNLYLFHQSIAPAGALGSISGVPQNVVTIGLGTGQGIVEEAFNNDAPPRKKKYQTQAQIGNQFGNDYGHWVHGEFVVPLNIMSGTINSGFNSVVESRYKSGVHLTNLHHDIAGVNNETSIQGPFTEQHVGGLQYRHVDVNSGTDNNENRPEGWGLSIAEHPVDPSADGALGFLGADYESPYPSQSPKATRYRDEHAKRPVNLRNIKTISGSWKVGNYKNELEIFQASPAFQKTWAIEAYGNSSVNILPPFISTALPDTTNYQTLMGISPLSKGNIFGEHSNNRQPDGGILSSTPTIPAAYSTGSFSMYGLKFSDDDDQLQFTGIQSAGEPNYGIEIDSGNNGASSGFLAVLTGSTDNDLWSNTKTALETLNFTVNTSSVSGDTGKSFIFPNQVGSSGYLFMTSSLSHTFSGSDDFSISIWFRKPSATPVAQGYLFNFMSSSYAEQTAGNSGVSAAAYIDSSERLFFYIGGYETSGGGWTQNFKRYDNIISQATIGDWHHIVLMSDGSTALSGIKVYNNGSVTSEDSSGNLMEVSLNSPIVGQRDGHVRFFNALANSGVGRTSNELKNLDISDMAYYGQDLSALQVSRIYHEGHLVNLTQSNFSSFLPTSWYKMGAAPNDLIDIKDATNTDLFLEDVVGSNDLSGEKGGDTRTVTTGSSLSYPDYMNFYLTGSTQDAKFNGMTRIASLSDLPHIFFNLVQTAGGTAGQVGSTTYASDNVIEIPRTDLTGSQRNIVTRFSAPGGPEVQAIGYLDAYTQTYSAYNAMPYRNTSVLGSGSGEEGTIRVEDHLGLRRGLNSLRALHMGKFGIDHEYGQITSANYPSSGSFNKQHRNRSQRMEYSGSSIITGSNYDNAFINTPIPRSELQYSWIHNATSGSDAPTQRILGYAPRDGIVSSSVGFVEAIVFPSASSIIGR